MPRKKVSIKEIASAAGVSSALVSMVLNGKAKQYGIGEEATQRVLRIAREMNYQPNIMARGLRSGRSHLIGLVVADIANPFFAKLAREIEKQASEHGYTVIYGSSDDNSRRMNSFMQTLVNQGVDGIIAIPCEDTIKIAAELQEQKFPLVLVDRDYTDMKISSVLLDNEQAGRQITEYLINAGYRQISFVAYSGDLSHIQGRMSGYLQAMQAHGLTETVHRLDKSDSQESIRQILSAIRQGSEPTDALIFANNTLTIEGLYMIREAGLQVPDDVAVFGFDGGNAFDLFTPPVSYVCQPITEMGREAFSLLIKQLEASDPQPAEKVVLQSSFVYTDSSRARIQPTNPSTKKTI
ncbi:MAG: LacI family DNA-binding transcriptional regulator [Bacteroidales bacterium]|nr:LacI family DNA-binding transcriptional regulator [Bacteroidales bacterium]